MTYSLETRDFSEAVRRVKVAAVDTMKTFDDHRRKVAPEAVVSEPATNDPHERFLAAADAMAADGDDCAEPVAHTTLSRSQLNLFAELHRSIRLEDDEDARLGGFQAVRPGPGSSMLLFTADDKRLSGKRTHAIESALAESKARAFVTASLMRRKLARGEYGGTETTAEDCLDTAGITLDRSSRAWQQLLRQVQAAEVRAMDDIQARNSGNDPEHRGSDEFLVEIAAILVPKPVVPKPATSAPNPLPTASVSLSTTPSSCQPAENAYIESFNGTFHAERLKTHGSVSIDVGRGNMDARRDYYNYGSSRTVDRQQGADFTPERMIVSIAGLRETVASPGVV